MEEAALFRALLLQAMTIKPDRVTGMISSCLKVHACTSWLRIDVELILLGEIMRAQEELARIYCRSECTE